MEIINESEDKKDLLLKIESAYGNLDNEKGSYINNKWFSVSRIVEMIN